MNKREILDNIRRLAADNGGKAPGWKAFRSRFGLAESDWRPYLWLRWGDALREAGYEPNAFVTRHDELRLTKLLVDLAREVGHFPIEGEIIRKRKIDPTFPSASAFKTFGSKAHRATRLLEYCEADAGCQDVAAMCREVLATQSRHTEEAHVASSPAGYVYLLRHGSRREYKIGRTNNLIRREGEIGIELPERGEPIHTIKTDDPVGVERYWHMRFKEKRKNGEWFELSPQDVAAFRRWKNIH